MTDEVLVLKKVIEDLKEEISKQNIYIEDLETRLFQQNDIIITLESRLETEQFK